MFAAVTEDTVKSERETLFQFVVRANGGYTFCVLRVPKDTTHTKLN